MVKLSLRFDQAMPRRRFVLLAGLGSLATVSGLLASCAERDADDDDDDIEDAAATDDDPEPESDDEPDEDDEEVVDPDDDDEVGDDVPDDDADADVDNAEDDIDEIPEDFEPFDTPELDLETREAQLGEQVVTAEPWDNTWVGEVTDSWFIGITVADAYGSDPRETTVYLCDNDRGIVLNGEFPADEDTTSLSNDEAEVELTLIDDEITGTVSINGQDPESFDAEAATDDAGVYVAATEVDEVEVAARWIVLADGRQRGTSVCCAMGPGGIVVCWPCQHQR
jgi:hypothetical protein